MMAASTPASARQVRDVMHDQNDRVADEHADDGAGGDPETHPLAAEEWLASQILMAVADPRAVCQLALINKNFFSASKFDSVWRKLLPPAPHLDSVLQECDDKPLEYFHSLSKKDLYLHLCRSITLGRGLKKFWLDQRTGGECYMISARALAIAWGSSPEYWEWLPCRDAWFPEVAFLQSVCWFDIKGKFQQVLRPGSYVVSFRMQMRSASIWRWSPIKLSLQNLTYAHPPIKSRAFFHRRFPISKPPLSPPSTPQAGQSTADDDEHSESDRNMWVECDVGEFTVEENEDGAIEVEFSMREVEVLGWKRGFLLDGVLIRPSYVVKAQERPTESMGSIYGYTDGDGETSAGVEEGYDDPISVEIDDDYNLYGVEEDVEGISIDDEENDLSGVEDDVTDASGDELNTEIDEDKSEEANEGNEEEEPRLEHFVVS